MTNPLQSYAIGREDILAAEHFGDFKGRFLDLGAYDGIGGSITYLLADLGWEGVAVEPNWRVTAQWLGRMSGFQDRVKLIHGAMGKTHGVVPYWDSAGPWSTCNPDVQALGRERFGAVRMFLPTFTAADLLAAFPGPFHHVSIDLDGWSLDIMRELPWNEIGCRFAVIEALDGKDLGVDERPIVREYMENLGYKHLATTVDNVVMVK